ncbi:MAG: cell division protein SepF [Pseudonocardiaceae bacterium]
MSALHRLKAYFGMVPCEDLDEFGPDFRDEYGHGDYGSGEYGGHGEYGRDNYRRYEAGPIDPGREPAYAERAVRPPRRSGLDAYHDDFAPDPGARVAGGLHGGRRPSWATESPTRGSLALNAAADADTAPPVRVREPLPPPRTSMFAEDEDEAHPLARIVTLHPHTYYEARPIGERYREGTPVIMNLTAMEDKDAKRVVDFAAGLAFALRGSIDKVTNKVFLLSPPNVDVSAEDRRRIAEGGLFNQP